MRIFSIFLVSILILFTSSCSKEEIIHNDQDLVVIEDSDGEKIYKIFHSAEHKKNYEDFISGELTTDDILMKYNIPDSGLSTEEWTGIISGKSNPTDFDIRDSQLRKTGEKNNTFTQMLSEKVRNVSIPDIHENNTENYAAKTTSSSKTSTIAFVGNELYYFNIEYILWHESASATKIRDRSYQPINLYHGNPQSGGYSFYHKLEMKHVWWGTGPEWRNSFPSNNNPWTWGSSNHVRFTCYAWFKFFWTQTYITTGIY